MFSAGVPGIGTVIYSIRVGAVSSIDRLDVSLTKNVPRIIYQAENRARLFSIFFAGFFSGDTHLWILCGGVGTSVFLEFTTTC